MSTPTPKIGLSMIVKDEAPIIERCLTAALPLIDYVLIVDTGSTDGTPKIIERFLARHRLPGRVARHPWRGFADARSRALELMRKVASVDYAFMIDADDEPALAIDADTFKRTLVSDVCYPATVAGDVTSLRCAFISNRKPFRYWGVVHEELVCAETHVVQSAAGLTVVARRDSARVGDPLQYRKDADLLIAAIKTETNQALQRRYAFQIGQALKSHAEVTGDKAAFREAQRWLRRHAGIAEHEEEIYFSLFLSACCSLALDDPLDAVVGEFLRAHAVDPLRAEAAFEASRYYAKHGELGLAYDLAQTAVAADRPSLFQRCIPWIYDWGALDQLASVTFARGRMHEAIAICDRLLVEARNLPDPDRARIAANRTYAQAALQQPNG